MQVLTYFLHSLDRCSTVAFSGIWLYIWQAIAHRRRAARKSSSAAGKGTELDFVFVMVGGEGSLVRKRNRLKCSFASGDS